MSQSTIVRDLGRCDCPVPADPPWGPHDLDALARWRDGRKLTRSKAQLCRWFEAVGWTPDTVAGHIAERYELAGLWNGVTDDTLAVAALHRNLMLAVALCRVADRRGIRGLPDPPDPADRDAVVGMGATMPKLAALRWRELLESMTDDDARLIVESWHTSLAMVLADAFGADPAEWPEVPE